MPLTPEQIKELKQQLLLQVAHLPPEKKAEAEAQIEALSPQALELLIKQQQERNLKTQQNSIFRLIAEHKVSSYIIKEDAKAIAVLDINPISEGHTLVIPKEPIFPGKPIPTKIFSFCQKVAKLLSSSLEAKTTEIQTENKFGETIIHLIPVYNQPLSINSERHSAKPEELEKTLSKIANKIKKKKIIKIKKSEKSKPANQILKLSRRVP